MQAAGMTFSEMQNRVALALDVTTGDTDGLPTSAAERTLIERAINDAIPLVASAADWSWLRADVAIRIGEGAPGLIDADDESRYALPPHVHGQPLGLVYFKNVSSATTGELKRVNVSDVRSALLENSNPGNPRLCAFGQPSLGTVQVGQRSSWEMILYPVPLVPANVYATFEAKAAKFVLPGERGPWAAEVDQVVVDCAIVLMARRGKVAERVSLQELEGVYARSLTMAAAKDADRQPRTTGRPKSVTERGVTMSYRFYPDPATL